MGLRAAIPDVPRGYVVHRAASTWLVLDRALQQDLTKLQLADPGVRASLFARAPRRGRGDVPTVPLGPATSVVLRRYRHGGLLRGLTGALFLGPGRALRELSVTARAEAAGAPVPHVLCLVLWPVVGPFWSALIGTREERQGEDLLRVLERTEDRRSRCALARAVGAAIRRLHDAGVEHRDLQLRNVLVTGGPAPQIVVVDLDRARFHRQGLLPASRRAANLGRLARSAVKCGVWGRRVGRRELAAFAAAYTARSRALRAELRGRVHWERLKLAVHRLGYRLRLPPGPRADAPLRPA